MTLGNNPTDRGKLGKTKRHILTDKNGIPLSVVISSANAYDIKLVTDVIDNIVIKRPTNKTKKTGRRGRKLQPLCLDKAYNSEQEEQELIKRGYVLHIPPKKKRDETEKEEVKVITQRHSNRKKIFCKKIGYRANQIMA
ncbi:MAG TPA: transposase [Verrucomicrobiae bacterium]|nr:transposase [Verrucomicrobiae bacterium]